ncbi:MAG: hypothetical protein ABIA21_03910 [Candidatus Aenigmatarchaeota archaeon]
MKTKKEVFVFVMLVVVLLAGVFVSGCVDQTTSNIKSPDQASDAITNISNSVQDVTSILNDIDKDIG